MIHYPPFGLKDDWPGARQCPRKATIVTVPVKKLNHLQGSNTLSHLSLIPSRPRPHARKPQHPVRPPKATRHQANPAIPANHPPASPSATASIPHLTRSPVATRNPERAVAFPFFSPEHHAELEACRAGRHRFPLAFASCYHRRQSLPLPRAGVAIPFFLLDSPGAAVRALALVLRNGPGRACVRQSLLKEHGSGERARGRRILTPTHPRTKDMYAVQLVRDNVSSHHHHHLALYAEKLHCS
jgi:hypothetical protein